MPRLTPRGQIRVAHVQAQLAGDRVDDDAVAVADESDRTAVLDDIAWPQRVQPALAHGAAFFGSFRDLTATGFWTTKMGMEDLQYLGNKYVAEWRGCPDDALKQLGVRYPAE